MALPVSPIGQSGNNPAAEATVVQIDLTAPTGQIVTGAEFGLSTGSQDYNEYADPNFQAVADQYPVDLLRHNWDANTMMDAIFSPPASATSPNFTEIDEYLNQQANLTPFFDNSTGTQIVTLGFPSWLDISNASDQTLYANMVKLIAQHFAGMGEPIDDFELVNEPDHTGYSVTNLAHTFNVVAEALKSVNPNYELGGLTESYMIANDLQTFFNIAGPNIGFVSWHQYVTNGSDGKTPQDEVNDSMSWVESGASQVRSMMNTANIPASVPLFLGEYNLDYHDFSDPNNANMVGAVAAAATTYGMIESNTNMTMGALWETANDSAYGVFGSGSNYQVDSVGVVLSDLTKYMPGNIVPTTMPSNTPGLVGYTTTYQGGCQRALEMSPGSPQ